MKKRQFAMNSTQQKNSKICVRRDGSKKTNTKKKEQYVANKGNNRKLEIKNIQLIQNRIGSDRPFSVDVVFYILYFSLSYICKQKNRTKTKTNIIYDYDKNWNQSETKQKAQRNKKK